MIHFRVLVPKELTPEQEAHLRAFAEASGNAPIEPPRAKRGIFGRKKK